MSFTTSQGYFLKDGKPSFIVSGEIHYFRLDPKLWEKHLTLLKKSGANTTSTYIPWGWYETEEGLFDFTGATHPARDLVKYFELCAKAGLQLIVKPGPYILAEYELQGLPVWFVKKCTKNARALDEHGNIISQDLMSYMSDEFLRYAFLWYDKIMPLIGRCQESNGGPIVLMIENYRTGNVWKTFMKEKIITDGLSRIGFTTVTDVAENNSPFPREYSLEQNFPNPFNPTTMVAYSVPEASAVTLRVYDALGREVETLVNEKKEAGRYSVQFTADHLSSDVYFYRITAGNFVQTKKMTVLR